jgi:hypothetical protein
MPEFARVQRADRRAGNIVDLIPKCQLKMTGRMWPSIGRDGCIAAVKVDTRSSPRGEVS